MRVLPKGNRKGGSGFFFPGPRWSNALPIFAHGEKSALLLEGKAINVAL